MDWTWSWWVFIPSVAVLTIFSMFSRGAMNMQNIARYGQEADYNHDVAGAILGCFLAGTVYAAILTALVGFVL